MNYTIFKISLLLIIVFQAIIVAAQPGAYGSDLIFTVRNSDYRNYRVVWCSANENKRIILSPTDKGEYEVEAFKTPGGGFANGHIEIINNNDTMFIQHPMLDRGEAISLNIPFRKGKYVIPKMIYITQELFKPEYRKQLKPNLEGDWSEFEINAPNPIPTIILQRIELIRNRKAANYIRHLHFCDDECDDFFEYYNYPYYLRDYFTDRNFYIKLLGEGYPYQNGYYRSKYNFFGVLKGTNQYFLQIEENGIIEYGTLEIPIDRTVQEKNDTCYAGLLFPNLDDKITFSAYSYLKGEQPIVYGYYNGIEKCYESKYEIEMWGFFNIYIDKPDEAAFEIIKNEHSIDNNLIEK